MRYLRVSKTQVAKEIKRKGICKGFIVGNKVKEFHFFDGWCCACNFEVTTMEEYNKLRDAFERNLEKQLGSAASTYVYI